MTTTGGSTHPLSNTTQGTGLSKDTPREIHPAGTRVGRWLLEAHLGGGGFGDVYAARDGIGNFVALKALRPELAERPKALKAFFDEARAVNHIGHPDIVRINDHIKLNDRSHWLVMELLNGRTLRAALEEGPLEIRHALDLAARVAAVLAVTHGLGVAHCDLKPENLFLVEDDRCVKLLDFGIARLPTATAGGRAGTLGYMAPEVIAGYRANASADVFALGVTLYEMVHGKRPFPSREISQLSVQMLTQPPPPLSSARGDFVPLVVDELVREMLSPQPGERPSARSVGRRIGEIIPRR